MKRTFKSLLAAAGLTFIGLGSLLTATPAQSAVSVAPVRVGAPGFEITCYSRFGDQPNWPDDGVNADNAHYIYCGSEIASLPTNPTQAQLLALGVSARNAINVLPPHVKALMRSNAVSIIVYKDVFQDFASKNLTPSSTALDQAAFSKYSPFPPVSFRIICRTFFRIICRGFFRIICHTGNRYWYQERRSLYRVV